MQLVMALNRVLFDLINTRTQQLTFDKELRQKIFEYHLVQRSAGKQYKSILNGGGELHSSKFEFDLDGLWMDLIKRQFVYNSNSKKWAEVCTSKYIEIISVLQYAYTYIRFCIIPLTEKEFQNLG